MFLICIHLQPRQVPDVWKHDLYEDNDVRESRPLMSLTRNFQRDVSKRPAKLVISNLDFGVNDQDIEVLSILLCYSLNMFSCGRID
jgi:hypothetical protein